LLSAFGCGPRVVDVADEANVGSSSSTPATASSSAGATSSTSSSDGVTSTVSETGTTVSTDSSETGNESPTCFVLQNYDLGTDGKCDVEPPPPGDPCTTFQDTCPPGEKCNGSGECVEVVTRPAQLGEPCIELSPGMDDCDRGMTCTGGTCLANARCSLEWPHCDDPDARATDGRICSPGCDLLDPQCQPHAICRALNYAAVCSAGDYGLGEPGDDCIVGGGCRMGTVCYGDASAVHQHAPERVPGCTDRFRCCAELCRLSDGACSQPGAVCTSLSTMPEYFQACFGDAGVCLLPE
jgi:hypothetical protein